MIMNELANDASFDLLVSADDLNREGLFRKLNQLNMAHHLLLSRSDEAMKELGKSEYERLVENLESTIGTAESFHAFLVENRIALDEVMSNMNAMIFGRISDMVDMFEEYITQEDPLKDTILQLVPFVLSAFSEKSYISSAEIGQKGILRSHALTVYSDIYSFVKTHRTHTTKAHTNTEDAKQTAHMMQELYSALDGSVGEKHGLYLFAGLYLTMYNLRAGEILNMVNHKSTNTSAEV